ncbi:hypothetical protein ZOSMA_106G00690 [Zostera marina]|uniref:Glycolipid transfer protein domain-containing protein n=1 Tax=Zostera marina TaxID=29655 RepID=A0A0K9Q4H3_ZOSMR|nr:hypothetical protein ZOSMA_106G00690 [Zostera marina]
MAEVIDRPLVKLAKTFEDLAMRVDSQDEDLELGVLNHGLSLMLPLLRVLGIAFKLVEMDAVQKVDDLTETAKSVSSVKLMIENDIANDCVRTPYSPSRNLLRLIRGLDFCRLFFRNLLNEELSI